LNSVSETADLVGENLACRRGERLVFAGLDCRLPPGGALVLTGSNGSGKSSLLRLLAGLLVPAAGRLSWAGDVHPSKLPTDSRRYARVLASSRDTCIWEIPSFSAMRLCVSLATKRR